MKNYALTAAALLLIGQNALALEVPCLFNARPKMREELVKLDRPSLGKERHYILLDSNEVLNHLVKIEVPQKWNWLKTMKVGDVVYPVTRITDTTRNPGGFMVVRCNQKNPTQVTKVWWQPRANIILSDAQAAEVMSFPSEEHTGSSAPTTSESYETAAESLM